MAASRAEGNRGGTGRLADAALAADEDERSPQCSSPSKVASMPVIRMSDGEAIAASPPR